VATYQALCKRVCQRRCSWLVVFAGLADPSSAVCVYHDNANPGHMHRVDVSELPGGGVRVQAAAWAFRGWLCFVCFVHVVALRRYAVASDRSAFMGRFFASAKGISAVLQFSGVPLLFRQVPLTTILGAMPVAVLGAVVVMVVMPSLWVAALLLLIFKVTECVAPRGLIGCAPAVCSPRLLLLLLLLALFCLFQGTPCTRQHARCCTCHCRSRRDTWRRR